MKKHIRIINSIALVVVLLMLNLLAERFPVRFDLTENGRYTLSESTLSLLKGMPGQVEVVAVVSPELPVAYLPSVRGMAELLSEYADQSEGRLVFRMVSSADRKEMDEAAAAYGVVPVQVNAVESEGVSLRSVYMSAVLVWEGKREALPMVTPLAAPEYELTSTLYRLKGDAGRKKAGILQMAGSLTPESGAQGIAELLSATAAVSTVLPSDNLTQYDLLLLLAPKMPLSPAEKEAVIRYVVSGGKLLFAPIRVVADVSAGGAVAVNEGLAPFLQRNGLAIEESLVSDANGAMVTVEKLADGVPVSSAVKYPLFAQLLETDGSAATGGIRTATVLMPPVMLATGSGVTVTPLAWTADKTGTVEEPFDISLERSWTPADFPNGKALLAAGMQGKFTSGVPEIDSAAKEGHIIVMAGGDSIRDDAILSTGVAPMYLAAADVLGGQPELAALRGKVDLPSPVTLRDESAVALLKYTAIFLPPLFAILFGLVLMRLEKKRRAML